MGAAPLSWLAKIGGDTLKTKAKLLSSAINELYDNGSNKNGYIAYVSNDSLENIIENNISNMKQFIEYTFHVDNIIGTPFPSNNNVIVKVIVTNDNKNSYNVEVADTITSKKYYITKTNGTFGSWTTSIVDLDSNLQNANKSITMNASDNGVLTNGLLVDLYNKNGDSNKPKLVNNTTENKPSDCAWGTREVFFHSADETGQVSYLTIEITGCDTDGKPGLWQNVFDGNDWVGWTRVVTTSDLQHIIFADTLISLSNNKYGSITLDIPYQKVVAINLVYAGNVETYAPVLSYQNLNGKTNINIVCNAANTSTYGIRVSYLK